jgi:hypothetical protein
VEGTRTDNVLYPKKPKLTVQYKFYASELIDKKENRWTMVREWTVSPTWAKLIIPLFLTLELFST